ncbi:MAG: hypothetical protein ACRYG4_09970 [Janthinobacterium lividum]
MTRPARVRFGLAGIVLVLAGWLWFGRTPKISEPEAEARATRMLAAYIEQTGEPPLHFSSRRMMAYPDGWEFVWIYRPCADAAEMRIFVRRSGAAAYAMLPDCTPTRGFAVRPERT